MSRQECRRDQRAQRDIEAAGPSGFGPDSIENREPFFDRQPVASVELDSRPGLVFLETFDEDDVRCQVTEKLIRRAKWNAAHRLASEDYGALVSGENDRFCASGFEFSSVAVPFVIEWMVTVLDRRNSEA